MHKTDIVNDFLCTIVHFDNFLENYYIFVFFPSSVPMRKWWEKGDNDIKFPLIVVLRMLTNSMQFRMLTSSPTPPNKNQCPSKWPSVFLSRVRRCASLKAGMNKEKEPSDNFCHFISNSSSNRNSRERGNIYTWRRQYFPFCCQTIPKGMPICLVRIPRKI